MKLKNKIKHLIWKKKFCKTQFYSEICYYLTQFDGKKYDKNFSKNTYLVIDTETTGLNTNDNIISFGGIRIHNLEIDISDSLEAFIKNDTAGNEESIAIHGIRKTELEKGIDKYTFFKKLLFFIQGDILVGHHISFDKEILNREFKNFFSIELLNPILDTFDLALYYDGYTSEDALHFDENKKRLYTLDSLIERFKISSSGRHTSIGDALITAELFLKLLSKLKNKPNFDIRILFK